MFSVVNNIFSLNAQRSLSTNQQNLGLSLEKLSSGLRVNNAKDDAAALSISTQLNAQIVSMNQAVRNTNDGLSLLSVAEGAMVQSSNMLQRMRELAIQSASATIGTAQRATIDREYSSLKSEIDRVSLVTNFNGQFLLNGSMASSATANANPMIIQVDIQNTTTSKINLNNSVNLTNMDTTALNIQSTNILTSGSSQSALSFIDSAISTLTAARGNIGAVQNRLANTVANLQINIENTVAADSRLKDADMAMEISKFTRNQIMVQASTSMLAQANSVPQSILSLLK